MPRPLAAGPLILSASQLATCKIIHQTLQSCDSRRLHKMVEAHLAELESLAATNPAIDLDLAGLLATALTGALAAVQPTQLPHWDWLRTAIGYFAQAHDAAGDSLTLGLSDDALVIAAILEYCDLPQLSRLIREYLA